MTGPMHLPGRQARADGWHLAAGVSSLLQSHFKHFYQNKLFVMFPQSWALRSQSLILPAKDEVTPPGPQRPVAQKSNEKHLAQSVPLLSCNFHCAGSVLVPISSTNTHWASVVCYAEHCMLAWRFQKRADGKLTKLFKECYILFLYSWFTLVWLLIERAEVATAVITMSVN